MGANAAVALWLSNKIGRATWNGPEGGLARMPASYEIKYLHVNGAPWDRLAGIVNWMISIRGERIWEHVMVFC